MKLYLACNEKNTMKRSSVFVVTLPNQPLNGVSFLDSSISDIFGDKFYSDDVRYGARVAEQVNAKRSRDRHVNGEYDENRVKKKEDEPYVNCI